MMVRVFGDLDWITSIVKTIALILGTFIVYLAYKGYRRNNSKPLFFVALGFALITAGTIAEGVIYIFFVSSSAISDLLIAVATGTVVTVMGFLIIIYSIYTAK
jgi:hypothetical protein